MLHAQAQAESTKNENRGYILQQRLEQAAAAADEAQAALRREAAEELAARVKAAAAEAHESGAPVKLDASRASARCDGICCMAAYHGREYLYALIWFEMPTFLGRRTLSVCKRRRGADTHLAHVSVSTWSLTT